MTLRPWLEVARPRPDIADGSFDESLFAADLGMVAEGHGPADYVDPTSFAEKTYLTVNLRSALDELAAASMATRPPPASTDSRPNSAAAKPTPCLPRITFSARPTR